MSVFQYGPDVAARFPTIVGGVVHATGVSSGHPNAELVEAFRSEQRAALARIGQTALSDIPSLAAWRRAFRAFGVDPTAYRSAAEALLRRLTKQGSIPSINPLVDIGNLVSVRYGLPVAVFDLRSISGGIAVRLATGDETFTDLGSGERETPERGEVIFVDEAGLVVARRWCWRQAAESASDATTTGVIITVEGHHDDAPQDVRAALGALEALVRRHTSPTTLGTGVVDSRNLTFVPGVR